MTKHLAGAYAIGAAELLAGVPLVWAAWTLWPMVYRQSTSRVDDWLAAIAIAVAGPVLAAAGAAALLHSRLSYPVIRGTQIAAAVSEVGMILAGAGIYVVGRRRGGDWAGFTLLAGTVFVAVGALLLLLTLFGLRYLRRRLAESADLGG